MQPRPPWEEKRRCGALLRLRRAHLVRAAAKDIKLSPEAARASVDTADRAAKLGTDFKI